VLFKNWHKVSLFELIFLFFTLNFYPLIDKAVILAGGLGTRLKGLLGEITKMTGDSNKIKYQVRVDDTYYAVEYKKFLLWDSIEILLTSKNSFI
jgi:hypothetical protein